MSLTGSLEAMQTLTGRISYERVYPTIDPTLTIEGATADAKAAGDAIADAKKAGTDAQASLNAHTGNRSNPHGVTLAQLGVKASAAELDYVDGATSNIQAQLNALSAEKLPISGGKVTGALQVGDNLKFHSDNEGGNIRFTSGDNLHHYEIDAVDNHELRLYHGTNAGHANGAVEADKAITWDGDTGVLSLPAALPISSGGTGASDAATALANLGALSKAGGDVSGWFHFTGMNGFSWQTDDGTVFNIRPYTAGNLLQITTIPTNGTEHASLNITNDGKVWFGDAEAVRTNLGITPANIGAADAGHTHNYLPLSGGTVNGALQVGNNLKFHSDNEGGNIRFTSGDNLHHYEIDACENNLIRLYHGTNAGHANGAVEADKAITWDGDTGVLSLPAALPISSGGTGATDAAGALANLGGMPLSAKNMTLLWENENPNSAFGTTSATSLVLGLEGYDAVFFVYRVNTSDSWVMTRVLPIGHASFIDGNNQYHAVRRVSVWTSGVDIYDASIYRTYGTATADNSYLIPYKIYGVKWVH